MHFSQIFSVHFERFSGNSQMFAQPQIAEDAVCAVRQLTANSTQRLVIYCEVEQLPTILAHLKVLDDG